eukprot:1187878-Prorocentrum_minimum.AAC.4
MRVYPRFVCPIGPALEAQRQAETEKAAILKQAHEELEAARNARLEAEKVAEAARQTAESEKLAILSEARDLASQDQQQLDLSRQEWEAALSQAQVRDSGAWRGSREGLEGVWRGSGGV